MSLQRGFDTLHAVTPVWCVQRLVARSVTGAGEGSRAETQGGSEGSKEARDGQLHLDLWAWRWTLKRHPSNVGMTGRPRSTTQQSELSQPHHRLSPRLQRQMMPTSLPGPLTRRRPCHLAFLWWEDPGPMAARTKGSEHHGSRSGDKGRRGHGSDRRHDSSRSCHSPRQRESGERARPTTSSGGSSSRARHVNPTDAPGSSRASGKATDVRPSSSSTLSSASSPGDLGWS